jgi:hypothetical protein
MISAVFVLSMQHRHLTAQTPEQMTRISLFPPTGVSKCGKVTWTEFRALNGHIFCVCESKGDLQSQVVAISFLDLWNLL